MVYIPVAQRQQRPKAGRYIPVAERVKAEPAKPEPPKLRAADFEVGGMSTLLGEIGGMTLDPTQIRPSTVTPPPTPKEPVSKKLIVDGRVAFQLPDSLGGGAYFKDFIDIPRAEKKITYGGIKTQDDMERDHIISLFLDSPDIPENIKLRQSGNLIERFLNIPVQQIPPERRQEGKVKKEFEIYNRFKRGEVSREQAITELKRWEFEKEIEADLEVGPIDILSGLGKQIKNFGKEIVGSAMIGLDFLHRTGLQVVNGISAITSPLFVTGIKKLGDPQLKNISYEEIWKQGLQDWEDNLLKIGKPTELLEARVSGRRPELVKLLDDQWESVISEMQEAENERNWGKAVIAFGKGFGIEFMKGWANPFYLFSITGVREGSFKFAPKEKVIFQTELNPAKDRFLKGPGKVDTKKVKFKIEVKETPEIITIKNSGKVKVQPKPDLTGYAESTKNGTIKLKITNKGGKIYDKNIIKAVLEEPKLIGVAPPPTVVKPPIGIVPKPPRIVLKMAKTDEFKPITGKETSASTRKTVFVRQTDTGDTWKIDFVKSKKTGEVTVEKYVIREDGSEAFSDAKKLSKLEEGFETKDPKIIAKGFSAGESPSQFIAPEKVVKKAIEPEKVKPIKIEEKPLIKKVEPIPQPIIKEKFSTHYEKIKQELGLTGESILIDTKTNKIEAKKAFDYIQRNPKKAMRIAYDVENAPASQNAQAIRISLKEALRQAGKTAQADDIDRIVSKKLTIAAQELNLAKLDLASAGKRQITSLITSKRLEKIGNKLGEVDPEKAKEVARKKIKKDTFKARNEVVKSQAEITETNLKEIDNLINSIIC